MLNLLKFKEVADYTDHPHLQPDAPISGQAAYQLYIEATLPHLKRAGSRVLFQGQSGHFAIGPESEKWDVVLLVEHASVERFMAFCSG